MKKISIVFIFLSVLFSSCLDESSTVIIHSHTGVAEIPFEYSSEGHIVVNPIIKGDTLNFIFDTGAYLTIISPYIQDDGYLGSRLITDIHRNKDHVRICKLDLLQFAYIDLKNMTVGKVPIPYENVDGILGRDILENFCIKIDNEHKRILLSQNPSLINKEGIERQFNPLLNTIELVFDTDSTRRDFLFDTGSGMEVSVDSTVWNVKSIAERPRKIWKLLKGSLFQNGKEYASSTFFLSDLQLDTITFKNVVCTYDESINQNIIGSAFISRFRTVVFDYLNSKAFFELPANQSAIGLSKNQVNNASVFSMNLFFSRMNSLGLDFSFSRPFVVTEVLTSDAGPSVEIGDTLVGIDNVLFSEKIFNRSKDKQQYYLETDTIRQIELLQKTLYQRKKAIFLFLKDNETVAVNAERKNIFPVKPAMAYSYFYKHAASVFYAISFVKEKGKSLMIHVPYSTLSGEEIQITSYENGKEIRFTNNPEKLNDAILTN